MVTYTFNVHINNEPINFLEHCQNGLMRFVSGVLSCFDNCYFLYFHAKYMVIAEDSTNLKVIRESTICDRLMVEISTNAITEKKKRNF